MSVSFTTTQAKLYKQLNTYATNNLISLDELWNSDRLCVPVSQFADMMDLIGFTASPEDIDCLEEEGMEFISIENVLEGVEKWKSEEESVSQFLKKKNPRKPMPDFDNDSSNDNSSSEATGKSRMNGSNSKFLKEHSKKQLKQKIKLQQTLTDVKNQSDYEVTVKVGEANDICRKLKNGVSYILDTKGGQLQIVEVGKNGQAAITVKNFEKRYENFKRAIMNAIEEEDEDLNMEEDMKKVLVEVMCLSSELKKQIKILDQKGISYS